MPRDSDVPILRESVDGHWARPRALRPLLPMAHGEDKIFNAIVNKQDEHHGHERKAECEPTPHDAPVLRSPK